MALSRSERMHRQMISRPIRCAFCTAPMDGAHEHNEGCPAAAPGRDNPLDDWRTDAACTTSGLGPEAWFDEDPDRNRAAANICERCPVRQECLNVALEGKELWGIWGGLYPAERARLWGRTYPRAYGQVLTPRRKGEDLS